MYWRRFVPAGIEQRREDNLIMEQEIATMEVNYLGHLFTLGRGELGRQLPHITTELRKTLLTSALCIQHVLHRVLFLSGNSLLE